MTNCLFTANEKSRTSHRVDLLREKEIWKRGKNTEIKMEMSRRGR
jgi:hypothetical protein